MHGTTGWLILQVDLKNDFISITRPTILEAQDRQCLSMLPWVRQALQTAPLLVWRDVTWSTRGVRQGYLLGPFLFAAGIQADLDALTPGGSLQRLYLDDGVIMGSVVEV